MRPRCDASTSSRASPCGPRGSGVMSSPTASGLEPIVVNDNVPSAMTSRVDFEAEGLLDGVEGEAREARMELLEQLIADGATLEELKRAVKENRLAFVP